MAAPPLPLEVTPTVPTTRPAVPPTSRVAALLTDPHLWLPVAVLVAGLAVLAWVHR